MTIFAEPSAGVTPTAAVTTDRRAQTRRYVMTPPRHFAVDYAINPWMDTTNPVDTTVAVSAGGAAPDPLPGEGTRGRPARPGTGAARHGLRGQRRTHHRSDGSGRSL